MDVYEVIAARKTIRDFEQRQVSMETVRRLIAAGLEAPSHDHMRDWHFVLLQDRSRRMDLLERTITRRSPEEAREIVDGWGMVDDVQRQMYIEGIPKQYSMLLEAGCLIIPCFRQEAPLLEPETLSSLNAFASIWCCIENILVAAASEGIFGVTRIPSALEVEAIRQALDVPPAYQIPCWLALGYPTATARRAEQKPVSLDERVHLNEW
jgi:nitroreductase